MLFCSNLLCLISQEEEQQVQRQRNIESDELSFGLENSNSVIFGRVAIRPAGTASKGTER